MPDRVTAQYDNNVNDNVPGRSLPVGDEEVCNNPNLPSVETDHNLEDDAGTGTGWVDVAHFPAEPPGVADQPKLAADRAKLAPKGDSATPQTSRTYVPQDRSCMALGAGSSAGGAGAALTTAGNIFLDAKGVCTVQAAANLTVQTNAGMGLFSQSGTQTHSQDKVEIYAGGGTAPGPCGTGGVADPVPGGPPAATAEMVTNIGCNVVSVAKAANDIAGIIRGGNLTNSEVSALTRIADGLTVLKGATDIANKGVVSNILAVDPSNKTAKEWGTNLDLISAGLGLGSAGFSNSAEISKAMSGENGVGFLSALGSVSPGILSSLLGAGSSVSGALSGSKYLNKALGGTTGPSKEFREAAAKAANAGNGAGGPGAGAVAGGPLDVEERAAGSIKMVCNLKQGGNAPEAIDFKTLGIFGVNAVTAVDFATTNWGAFAIYKFEVKSGVMAEVKCRKFEMKAYAKGTLTSPHITVKATTKSDLDGNVRVTKTLHVDKHVVLHNKLFVKKDTHLKKTLLVKQDTTVKGNENVRKPVTFKGNLTINGTSTSLGKLKVQSDVKFG